VKCLKRSKFVGAFLFLTLIQCTTNAAKGAEKKHVAKLERKIKPKNEAKHGSIVSVKLKKQNNIAKLFGKPGALS